MNRKRLLFLASGISLLALVGIYLLDQGHRITVTSNEWNSPRFDRFYWTDVEYSQYEGAEKLYTAHVDEVTQRKWKIGPYTVSPIKVIKMTNLRIEVAERGAGTGRNTSGHTPGGTRDPLSRLPLHGLFRQGFAGQKLGIVRGVYIQGFEYLVVRGSHEQLAVSAKRATVAIPSGRITFDDGFSIISSHGQVLRARKGHWRPEDGVFVLPESYLLEDTGGTREGVGAAFAIDPSGRIEEVEDGVWRKKAPLRE